MSNLRERSILVSLTISSWMGTKHDKGVSKEVDDFHNTKDAGRYIKILIPKKELARISAVAMKIRVMHSTQTLPWGNSGDRLLPIQNFLDYMALMGDLKREFEKEVDEFVSRIEDIKADRKMELGDLYNEAEYPRDVRRKFSISLGMMSIGDAEDFRLDCSEEQEKAIRKEVKEEFTSRQNEAVQDLLTRAKEKIGHMAERLEGEGKIFDTVVSNIEDLIGLYHKLNFNDDPRIERLITEMQELLVDPAHLRMDKELRAAYAEKARKLEQMLA